MDTPHICPECNQEPLTDVFEVENQMCWFCMAEAALSVPYEAAA